MSHKRSSVNPRDPANPDYCLTTYLDFNGRAGHSGLFHRFAYETGYGNGLVSLQFDPDYRRNGRFYTVHIEDPSVGGAAGPDNARFPALYVRGYETTTSIATPGAIQREGVLIEWTVIDVNYFCRFATIILAGPDWGRGCDDPAAS